MGQNAHFTAREKNIGVTETQVDRRSRFGKPFLDSRLWAIRRAAHKAWILPQVCAARYQDLRNSKLGMIILTMKLSTTSWIAPRGGNYRISRLADGLPAIAFCCSEAKPQSVLNAVGQARHRQQCQ